MPSIVVDNISKSFGSVRALDEVSFAVEPGEIFGLLGPNGAGKTTTLRIILDLFKPDSGNVSILGGPMDEKKKSRIGYLPEERGLYQDIRLERCLTYLGTLKGMSKPEVQERLDGYLKRFDLDEHRRKKIKELSKGMQQKAQLIVTLLHQPELVIIDEPFSSLDPINTQMVKDLLKDERAQGKTIIMCTHQMHQVEELCDRIVLINEGRSVLYGELNDIRRQYARPEVDIRTWEDLPAVLPGVNEIRPTNGGARLILAPETKPQDLLRILVEKDIHLEQFEIAMPTLSEIFIEVVRGAEN
ncbi:MAG: ATP-binding cassette domain-containing protein [Anaerolineaceae bacterium]|nr:ATP-binding cassette domain-containing protein [Anaerolineaceae bacterium]